jgi:hypothetical protein
MLLLPSQAAKNRIHPRNTWAGAGVNSLLVNISSIDLPA